MTRAFCLLFSTAQDSHTSHCLGWSRISRWENTAAGKAQTFLPNNPLLPLSLPQAHAPVLSPVLCFAARRLWPSHPKGFLAAEAAAGNQSVGRFCRGIQHAGCKEPAVPADAGWLSGPPVLQVVKLLQTKAIPSACSCMEQAGAMQRWPHSPLGSDVRKAVGWGSGEADIN